MAVYKRLALTAIALWVVSTLVAAFVVSIEDRRRAPLEVMLQDFDAVSGERRVLLVGSSNVVYGLSAGQLNELTGIPARNAGVIGVRRGFTDYFRIAMEHVRPNDVVVVSDPLWIFPGSGSQHYGCKEPTGVSCILRNWKLAPALLNLVYRRGPDPVQRWPETRTPAGDVVFPRNVERKGTLPVAVTSPAPRFAGKGLRIAKEQIELIRSRGACPVIAFPPMLVREDVRRDWEREFSRTKDAFKAAGLGDLLVGSMVIETNPDLFFNDAYHISPTGREIWTQMVFKSLEHAKECRASDHR
jgi:hypothetical protein